MSYPILYEQINNVGTVPNDNGLGILTDCLECMITEERNGLYELEMKYPASGIHAKELTERRILKAKPNFTDAPQLFRIYKITKVLNGSFTVYARHISYDLSGYTISSGTAANAVLACDLLQSNAPGWTINTDKDVTANFRIHEPSSVRSWFGGKEGSFLDVFGTGEWKYDNFTCSFLAHRGVNRGVTVKYAKNLLSLDQDKDSSNIITGVIAYWKDTNSGTIVISDTQTTSVTLDVPNVYVLDCSSDFQEIPTKTQLNDKALNYISNHETAFAKQNIKLDFLQIGTLKDRVDLCDTVTIEYPEFGISGTAKCITTKWDVLKERYDSIEIGEPKTNITDTIVSVEKTSKNAITQTQMNGAIDRATSLITGNSGGYVVLHDSDSDGQPDELLIMNTPDISTATKVWRWNLAGLGYSDTGYDGTYGLAMTMDGAINCAFLKTGNLVFGGTTGNEDGTLTIRDASDNVIANFSKTGCTVKGNIYAKTFIADAGETTEIHIGGAAGDTGERPSNGIHIYDEQRGMALPAISLGQMYNSNNEAIIQALHLRSGSNSLSSSARLFAVNDPAIYNNWRSALLLLGHNTQDDSVKIGVALSSRDVDTATNKAAGYIRIDANTQDPYGLYYDGNGNDAKNILLGGMQLAGGVLKQAKNTDDLKAIVLRGSTNGSYIYLYKNNAMTHELDVQQNGGFMSLFNSSGTDTINLWGYNGKITCVSLTQTSTRKVKENIEEMTEDEASKILLLVPVTYDFKDKDCGTDKRGFIAEDVEEVIPQVVTKDEDGDPQGINYTELIPYLTKMIQMQQKQINDLELRVKELERSK